MPSEIRRTERIAFYALANGLLITMPWILPTARLLTLAIIAGINIIVLYGLVLLYGHTGILSVAHAALMGIGAYTGGMLAKHLDMMFWAALPIALLCSFVIAGLLAYPSFRVKGHHFLILTFAFGELFVIILRNGEEYGTGGAEGLMIYERIPPVLGISFYELESFYYLVLIVGYLAMLAAFIVSRSKLGRTLRGIRENEELAESIGIHALHYKILIFAISGLFAGWGGILYGYHLRHIAPQLFGAFGSIQLVLMLLLGGSRSFWGPVVGVVIVFFLPEVLGLDPVQSRILYGALLILVILLLPRGLAAGIRQQYLSARGLAGRGESSREDLIEGPRGGTTYDPVSVSRKIFTGNSADVSARTLTISDVRKRFGGLVALDGISIEIRPGELVGIIGPNGSGKTTLFNVICGVHQVSAGEIIWGGTDISGMRMHAISVAGIGRSFQREMVFDGLTVEENVKLAVEHGSRSVKRNHVDILGFMGLLPYRSYRADELSYGFLRRLGVALAIGTGPSLLLLDEPTAGMNPRATSEMLDLIRAMPAQGLAVCVIDHDMDLITKLCERVVVLDNGKVIADGLPVQVLGDPKVRRVYLGGDYDASAD